MKSTIFSSMHRIFPHIQASLYTTMKFFFILVPWSVLTQMRTASFTEFVKSASTLKPQKAKKEE